MKAKPVFRYDPTQRKFRLFRLLWTRGVVGDGKGYSAKLAVSLRPKLFQFQRDFNEWRVTILGIDIHNKLSYGGVII